MYSETSSNGVTTTYSYDGEGHRITKSISGAAPTIYVYDASGQMTAEYGTSTDPLTGTLYLTADTLGSFNRESTNSSLCKLALFHPPELFARR